MVDKLNVAPAPAAVAVPAGEVVYAGLDHATIRWAAQTSATGGGDPSNAYSWPIAGTKVYLTAPPQIEVSQGHFAPAQEHATQLAGQAQWKEQGYLSSTHYAEDMQAVGEALMETIEANYASLQAAGWERPMDSPAEIVVDLLNLLDEAKTAAPAQAQEDARDALTLVELDQLDRAIEHFVEGEDTDVDWRLLTRAACLGFLECERFTVPPTARAAIDAARAAQGSAL